MAKLTYKQKRRLPKTQMAKKTGRYDGSYPIPDIAHGRNALARGAQQVKKGNLGASGYAAIKRKVYAKFPSLRK
jgi:hypothetical protein